MRSRFFRLIELPFLPVILAPFMLFLIPLLGGQVLFWALPVTQFIPWRVYALEQMAQGILPLWNPLNGMGAPLLANYQLALFYPPGWLVYLAGAVLGAPGMAWMHTLLVPLHLAWAGLGMALLGRRLGFSNLGQAISGLAFGLGGYWVARAGFYSMIWAGAWLPWVILGACAVAAPLRGDQVSSGRLLKYGLIIPIALQLLAGHAQLSWYTLTLAGVWVLVGAWVNGRWKGAGRALGLMAINSLLAAAVAAVQLLPTAEYLLQSQRASAVDIELGLTYSFWPWRFLTLLAPGFFGTPAAGNYWGYASFWEDATYIGFLPLALGLAALVWAGRRGNTNPLQPLVRLAAGCIGIGIFLGLGNNTPLFLLLVRWVPTFSLFNAPARWMVWAVFGLCLLAGAGAGAWRRPTGKALRRFKRLMVAALAVTLGAAATWLTLRDVKITFIEASALLGVWASGACVLTIMQPKDLNAPAYRRWTWMVIAWVVLDLLWAGWNSQPTVPADYFAPGQSAAVSAQGRAYLNAEDEYALKFKRFFRFSDYRPVEDWDHLRQVALPNMNLLADTRFEFANNFDPFVPGRYARWMKGLEQAGSPQREGMLRLMAVTSLIKLEPTRPSGITVTAAAAYSRVRWLGCANWVQDAEEAWLAVQEGLEGGSAQPDALLVLEGSASRPVEGSGGTQPACTAIVTGSAKILDEQPDRIRIAVDAPADGFILLADTWYPGWQTLVDGQASQALRANYLFRATPLAAGKHQVEWVYRPTWFYIGVVLSGAALLFMLLLSRLITDRNK